MCVTIILIFRAGTSTHKLTHTHTKHEIRTDTEHERERTSHVDRSRWSLELNWRVVVVGTVEFGTQRLWWAHRRHACVLCTREQQPIAEVVLLHTMWWSVTRRNSASMLSDRCESIDDDSIERAYEMGTVSNMFWVPFAVHACVRMRHAQCVSHTIGWQCWGYLFWNVWCSCDATTYNMEFL